MLMKNSIGHEKSVSVM